MPTASIGTANALANAAWIDSVAFGAREVAEEATCGQGGEGGFDAVFDGLGDVVVEDPGELVQLDQRSEEVLAQRR